MTEPALRLSELAPATAVSVPLQPFVAAGSAASTMPAGNGSVNAMPVAAKALLVLSMVRVRVDSCPTFTLVGLNTLVKPNVSGVMAVSASVAELLPGTRSAVDAAILAVLLSVPVAFGSTRQLAV